FNISRYFLTGMNAEHSSRGLLFHPRYTPFRVKRKNRGIRVIFLSSLFELCINGKNFMHI
ncbi:MAG: hypothetical protein ACPL7E_08215, partial [bacterium]